MRYVELGFVGVLERVLWVIHLRDNLGHMIMSCILLKSHQHMKELYCSTEIVLVYKELIFSATLRMLEK